MESGPNVDIVAETPYYWPMLKDESFDVVISGQAFEHIEFFWLTFSEMSRVLKRGGCVIAPRGSERHRCPVDCYRFDADGMIALAKHANLKPLHASMNLAPLGASIDWYSINDVDADAMLIAEKPVDWSGTIDPKTYIFKQNDLENLATGFIGLQRQYKNMFLQKRRVDGRRKILYGAGYVGEVAFDCYGADMVHASADMHKHGTEYLGKAVIHPSSISDLSSDYEIIVCAEKYDEMVDYLNNMGVEKYELFYDAYMR